MHIFVHWIEQNARGVSQSVWAWRQENALFLSPSGIETPFFESVDSHLLNIFALFVNNRVTDFFFAVLFAAVLLHSKPLNYETR